MWLALSHKNCGSDLILETTEWARLSLPCKIVIAVFGTDTFNSAHPNYVGSSILKIAGFFYRRRQTSEKLTSHRGA